VSTFVYDAASNLIAEVNALGYRSTLTYDALNRLIATTDPLNHTNTTAYDAAGNVIQTIDALGYVNTFTYDALNRQASAQNPDGGINTTVYDAAGNVIASVDALGDRTTFSYDALNRQTQSTSALNGIATTVYDAVGNVTAVVDAVGNRTTMVYDVLNRMIQETDPLNHSATFAYDAASRRVSETDRDGRVINFSYDALNEETGETWIVSGSTVNTLTFTYDAAGNMLTAANNAGTYTMAYDALNRISSEQEPFGAVLTMTYDAVGNRTQVQDSFGGITTSVYDAAGRMTTLEFGGSGQTQLRLDFTYTARDQIATETRYSDLAGSHEIGYTTFMYDANMNLTSLQHQNGSGTCLASFLYNYDLAGRLKSEIDNGGAPVTYSYDGTAQLLGDGSNNYSYDLNGNRTNTGYHTNAANELSSDGSWNFTYDNEGNIIQAVSIATGTTWNFTYDNQNYLTGSTEKTSTGTLMEQSTYVYDALGNRIEKDVYIQTPATSTVQRFAYDGSAIWADMNGSNGLVTRYLRGDQVDELFARISSGGTAAWYLTDHLGTVRAITDNSGVVQDKLTYDSFGNVLSETSPSFGDRWKYAGRELDGETNLQYSAGGYFDSLRGRWITQNPLGLGTNTPNLYEYGANSPTNLNESGDLRGLGTVGTPGTTMAATGLAGAGTGTTGLVGAGAAAGAAGLAFTGASTSSLGTPSGSQPGGMMSSAMGGGLSSLMAAGGPPDLMAGGTQHKLGLPAMPGMGGMAGGQTWMDLLRKLLPKLPELDRNSIDPRYTLPAKPGATSVDPGFKVPGPAGVSSEGGVAIANLPTQQPSAQNQLAGIAGVVAALLASPGGLLGAFLASRAPAAGAGPAPSTNTPGPSDPYFDLGPGQYANCDPRFTVPGNADNSNDKCQILPNSPQGPSLPSPEQVAGGLLPILGLMPGGGQGTSEFFWNGGSGMTWGDLAKMIGSAILAPGGPGASDMMWRPGQNDPGMATVLPGYQELPPAEPTIPGGLGGTGPGFVGPPGSGSGSGGGQGGGGSSGQAPGAGGWGTLPGVWNDGQQPTMWDIGPGTPGGPGGIGLLPYNPAGGVGLGQLGIASNGGLPTGMLGSLAGKQVSAMLPSWAGKLMNNLPNLAAKLADAAKGPNLAPSDWITLPRIISVKPVSNSPDMASVVGAAGMPQGTLNTEVGRDRDMLGVSRMQATGDASKQLEKMLDNAKGPLHMGQGPFYGPNGNSNMLEALGHAGKQMKIMMEYALTAPSLMCGPIGFAANMTLAMMHLAAGEPWHALLDLGGAVGSGLFCFAGGTPILTPDGDKSIEDFKPGDWLLSAPEHDPSAPPEPRQVEDVFQATAALLNLHVGGRVIRTSVLHPFYVLNQGWRCADELRPGDQLRSHDGNWTPAEAVTAAGEVTTVYNLRISEYHTYFVGRRDWAFSVWAHNACAGMGNIGSHGRVPASTVLGAAEKWLGKGYREIAAGVYRSANGLRQFRMTIRDLLPTHGSIGPHVHFEALSPGGRVIENLHIPV
jgi:RHS repeat-associated protein